MKRINLDGVIGWDVIAADVRAALEEAKGDDIDLTISSPGGSVYEGLAIYNAIRDYRRDGGKITARIVGLAASMATYIPLAASKVVVEDNAIWMIHNPWSIALGDQNDLRKEADILDGISGVLATAYIKKTGKGRDEIRAMMDEETYIYGESIVSMGFADSVEPAGDGAENRDDAVAMALTEIESMKHTMKQEPERQQLDKAAAMLKDITSQIIETPGVAGDIPAAKAEHEEVKMNSLEELKKEAPALYAEAVQIGEKQGIEKERARQAQLDEQLEADPGNVKLAEVIAKAKADGKALADVQTQIVVAVRDGKLAGENPEGVETASGLTPLSEEDRKAMKIAGFESEEEYRKYAQMAESGEVA
jgi:ATP-dependent protease ClpP protease subunit